MILAGASVFASAIATMLAQRTGRAATRCRSPAAALTIIVIVFCELAPKIYAAANPEGVALHAAGIYRVLVARHAPGAVADQSARLRLPAPVRRGPRDALGLQSLSADELRTVVTEAAPVIPARHRQMLLSILDLGRITVNDIMVPRQEIAGHRRQRATGRTSSTQLRQTPHTRLPVYEGELDNLIGLLHMKRVAHELVRGTFTRERLIEIARGREAYFVPEGTALNVQLAHFQRNRRRFAFVVNEYGDIEGLVTLEDILEEIVGRVHHRSGHDHAQGRARGASRRLHRQCQRHDPRAQPRARLGAADRRPEDGERPACSSTWRPSPSRGTMVRVGDYEFEVLQIADNAIRTVRVRAAGGGEGRLGRRAHGRERLADAADRRSRSGPRAAPCAARCPAARWPRAKPCVCASRSRSSP